MGTKTAGELIGDLRILLQDTSNVSQRWSDAVLRGYLNTAALAIVRLLPQLNAKTYAHTLVPTTVHQALPPDAVAFLAVLGNLNPTTEAFVSTVTPFDVSRMDASAQTWRNPSVTGTRIYQAAPDPADSFKFYVYPAATGKISVQYAVIPTAMADSDDTFPLSDIVAEPAVYYAAYSALIVDADNDRSATQANLYRQTFFSLLSLPDPSAEKRR